MQDRGTARNLPNEGHIPQPMGAATSMDGVRVDRTHQDITPAGSGHFGPVQAFRLGVGDDLQTGRLAAGFHLGKQGLHLGEGKPFLFKAPIPGAGVLTPGKDCGGIGHSDVVVSQHDDEFRRMFHIGPRLSLDIIIDVQSRYLHYTLENAVWQGQKAKETVKIRQK